MSNLFPWMKRYLRWPRPVKASVDIKDLRSPQFDKSKTQMFLNCAKLPFCNDCNLLFCKCIAVTLCDNQIGTWPKVSLDISLNEFHDKSMTKVVNLVVGKWRGMLLKLRPLQFQRSPVFPQLSTYFDVLQRISGSEPYGNEKKDKVVNEKGLFLRQHTGKHNAKYEMHRIMEFVLVLMIKKNYCLFTYYIGKGNKKSVRGIRHLKYQCESTK